MEENLKWPVQIFDSSSSLEVDAEALNGIVLLGLRLLLEDHPASDLNEQKVSGISEKWMAKSFSLDETHALLMKNISKSVKSGLEFISKNTFLKMKQQLEFINYQEELLFSITNSYCPLDPSKKGSVSYAYEVRAIDRKAAKFLISVVNDKE